MLRAFDHAVRRRPWDAEYPVHNPDAVSYPSDDLWNRRPVEARLISCRAFREMGVVTPLHLPADWEGVRP